MAKRRRLSPLMEVEPSAVDTGRAGIEPLLSTSSAPSRRAPIAEVAGAAAAEAALADLADEIAASRASGRLAVDVPLSAIDENYLVRDRIALDEDELETLTVSLRTRGQQVPLDVVDLGGGRYGLISGWRRLTALRRLHEGTGEDRFATALVVIRRPAEAGEAYRAMVEENEIRAGLSFYERARIVVLAVEKGIFADTEAAVQALFGAISRPRRSKIRSFIRVVEHLDGYLRFPQAIPERLGLALAKKIEAVHLFRGRLVCRLVEESPHTEDEERRILETALRDGPGKTAVPGLEAAPGIHLSGREGALTLKGPGVDVAFRGQLEAWLARR